MNIHQFHSGSAVGDAITNQMLAIQKILRQQGFQSEIFVDHIAPALQGRLKSLKDYKGSKDQILLVHHSMGFDSFDTITALPDQKILVYHNITPEAFFADEGTRQYIRIGREQLRKYRCHVVHAIAASNYNRKELLACGYDNVTVMPVQTNLQEFLAWKPAADLIERYKNQTNIAFVGRVVPNKCHEDILQSFAYYRKHYNRDAKLMFIGDTSLENYVSWLKDLAAKLGISDSLVFTGKVSEAELKAYYKLMALFVCMSEHEGFGVPLLEAMAMQVPVLAYRAAAVPETMGGAGVLVTTKDSAIVGEMINMLIADEQLRRDVISRQNERIALLDRSETQGVLLSVIDKVRQSGPYQTTVQVQGPFETNYSLAIVNRNLAKALAAKSGLDVSLYATEGPGDYVPKEKDLSDKPEIKALWAKSKEAVYPDVVIRNLYPPRVFDAPGGLNFLNFAWEETRVPAQYVESFNRYLDGIGVTSSFVGQALRDSGLTIPIAVTGNGVTLHPDFASIKPYDLPTTKRFRFLHVSSCFPRKGVDILLKAYFAAFTSQDDVVLVIKTFPNPHNETEAQLRALQEQTKEPPEVLLINEDLPQKTIASLYKAASCYVHTARGEGFGLPVAEAMLAGVPVIVSPNTGMADFCNETTAVLVDFKMVPSASHVAVEDALWAETDSKDLSQKMRAVVFEPQPLALEAKVAAAQQYIETQYTWDKVAERWQNFIAATQRDKYKPKVAMVTTWNSRCGIAEYSKFLIETLTERADFSIYANYGVELMEPEDSSVVERCWHSRWEGGLEKLQEAVLRSDCEFVHFQFNFGFFEIGQLAAFIDAVANYKKIIITFHSTKDCQIGSELVSLQQIAASLQKTTLIVHQQDDVDRLHGFGLTDNVYLIPHGNVTVPYIDKEQLRKELAVSHGPILATFGFLLPHKGILELIRAVALLRKQYPSILLLGSCAIHSDGVSSEYKEKCLEEIARLDLEKNITLVTDFLSPQEAMTLLQLADITVLPYQPTKESASGAVRFCIAAERPLVTTKQPIFAEVQGCSLQVEACTPELLAAGIQKLLADQPLQQAFTAALREKTAQTSWPVVGKQYMDLLHQFQC